MSVEGRIPPCDLDAEAAVLSAILLDEKAIDRVLAILLDEHFYSESHRRIYEAAADLRSKSQPVDIVQVGAWLKAKDRLQQVGGMSYITQILDAAPVVANVEAYAKIVKDKARERKMIAACRTTASQGYFDHGDTQEWISSTVETMQRIAQDGVTQSRTATLRECSKEAVQDMQTAARQGGSVGITTGFSRVDAITGGSHASDLTIVAARPGLGKTSYVLNVVVNGALASKRRCDDAVKAGKPLTEIVGAVVFTLEMPRKQIAHRILCSEGRVDVSRARNGQLTPLDWTKLTTAATQVGPLPIWVDDTPGITLMELRVIVRMKRMEFDKPPSEGFGGQRIGLVVVDYLQLMKGARGAHSREQEISEISRGLKAMAKEFNVAVIALSQLNRAVETRGEKNRRPQLSDLRESGAIEQDADNVIFLYRDDYYNKDTTERNIAEAIVAKQRNGPTGTAKIRFDSEYTRFDNLAEGQYVDGEPDR